MQATQGPHELSTESIEAHREHAHELLRTLREEAGREAGALGVGEEVLDDCYAQLLTLEVDRRGLEREMTTLAESGDPAVASRLRQLSILVRSVVDAGEQLRSALEAERVRFEREA